MGSEEELTTKTTHQGCVSQPLSPPPQRTPQTFLSSFNPKKEDNCHHLVTAVASATQTVEKPAQHHTHQVSGPASNFGLHTLPSCSSP